jgi:hypothetical protein
VREISGDRPFGYHVFVSHGTKKEPSSAGAALAAAPGTVDEFAAELTSALGHAAGTRRAQQFKLDYDWQDIWPGDRWRRRIETLMDRADVAIILLTKRSVGRVWPQQEAVKLTGWKPAVVVEWESGVWEVIDREAHSRDELADNGWDLDPTNLATGPVGLAERQIVRWMPDTEELVRRVAERLLSLPYWQSPRDDGWNRGVRLLAGIIAKGFAEPDGKDELWQLIDQHGNGAAAKMSDRDSVATFARQLVVTRLVKNPDGITATCPEGEQAEEKHDTGVLLSFEDTVPIIQRATTRNNEWALEALAEIARFWPDPRAVARLRGGVEYIGTDGDDAPGPVVEFKAVSFTGARVRKWYVQRAHLELTRAPSCENLPPSQLELAEQHASAAQGLMKLLGGSRKIVYFHVPLQGWGQLEKYIRIIENHPWRSTTAGARKVRTFVFSVENEGESAPENPRKNYTRVLPVLSAEDERLIEDDFTAALANLQSGDGEPSPDGYRDTIVRKTRSMGR